MRVEFERPDRLVLVGLVPCGKLVLGVRHWAIRLDLAAPGNSPQVDVAVDAATEEH